MTRKAGSIVINRLRDRIGLGRYFGFWSPGDRLPSVREVAALEAVDRKTAAAAYRRLEKEGLVRVEPRSGVYLEEERGAAPDPLRRLHLNWLERTLSSAEEMGLDADTVSRMFQGVSAVTRRRVPVVDPDVTHATLLARQLSERTGLECVATKPDRLPAQVGPLRDPPFVLATPRGRAGLKALEDRVPIVLITLAADLFHNVCQAASEDRVVVLVGSETLAAELKRALDGALADHADRVDVRRPRPQAAHPSTLEGDARVLAWPGAAGPNADGPDGVDGQIASRLVADSTVAEVRGQVARAALDHVSMSSASSTRR